MIKSKKHSQPKTDKIQNCVAIYAALLITLMFCFLPLLLSFCRLSWSDTTRVRAKYATVLHSKIMYCTAKSRFHRFSGRRTGKTKFWSGFFWSGITNLLFDGLTYNTRRHFAHCSYFSSPLWRVLYVKLSNKMYIFSISMVLRSADLRSAKELRYHSEWLTLGKLTFFFFFSVHTW